MRSVSSLALSARATGFSGAGTKRPLPSRGCFGSAQPRKTNSPTATFTTVAQYASTASAGPSSSRPAASKATSDVHVQPKRQESGQRKLQPALLRLGSKQPLVPSLTPTLLRESNQKDHTLRRRRAQRLSQLHTALQSGSPDAVWSAYLDLQKPNSGSRRSLSVDASSSASTLSAREFNAVVRVISKEEARTKSNVNRILRLMSDVRGQQHRLLTQLQHAYDTNNEVRTRLIQHELQEWDSVVSPQLLNTTITHIGSSLRTVGLEEVDQILDQLLTYEANEHSRARSSTLGQDQQSSKQGSHSYTKNASDHLHTAMLSPTAQPALSKSRGSQRHSPFPDLATYNAILNIVTRTVHRSSTDPRSQLNQDHTTDDDEDAMANLTDPHLDQQSEQLSASLASKLRRFELDADAAPSHVSALERADRLFHSVIERMQRKSGIEPDAVTFNIMVTMYCLLGRWDAVHRVMRTANDKGAINVDCINNVLSHWLVRAPASATRRDDSNHAAESSTDQALEIYRQLRQNLVSAELASQGLTIAYGRNDSRSRMAPEEAGYDYRSRDLGPLAWPDENEHAPKASTHVSNAAAANDAVQTILGLPSLPSHITPDEITHALMIDSLTREGRFADAFSVFKDLVSTPIRRRDTKTQANRPRNSDTSAETQESRMQPTLAMFISFFRGFSRHGRPSTAVAFDASQPENSTWEAVPREPQDNEQPDQEAALTQSTADGVHAAQLQLWTIDTFQEIFDAFLHFEPDVALVLPAGRKDLGLDAGHESLDHRVPTALGWLTSAEKRRLDAARLAPSTNQLFWIITAIRRVSNDHAQWSLAMWQRVVDKFSKPSSAGKLGWTGFRLDNRLHRVLEHLEERVAQEHGDGDGKP